MIRVIRDDRETGYLSNYYLSPMVFEEIGPYRFSLSCFESLKYKKPKSRNIYKTMAPSTAHLRGQKIKPLRPDWEKVKVQLMTKVMFEKFWQNPVIQDKLLATGNEEFLFCNTYHDNYWGYCTCDECEAKRQSGELVSENIEGKCLFEARQMIRDKITNDAEKEYRKSIRSLKELYIRPDESEFGTKFKKKTNPETQIQNTSN